MGVEAFCGLCDSQVALTSPYFSPHQNYGGRFRVFSTGTRDSLNLYKFLHSVVFWGCFPTFSGSRLQTFSLSFPVGPLGNFSTTNMDSKGDGDALREITLKKLRDNKDGCLRRSVLICNFLRLLEHEKKKENSAGKSPNSSPEPSTSRQM